MTGGAEGIGRGIADVLAEQGAAVGIVDVNAERGVATAEEIGATTRAGTLFAHCDVGVEPAVERAVADVVSALGAPTILVNNAALFLFRGIEATPEEWAQVVGVNIISQRCLRQARRCPYARSGRRSDREHRLRLELHRAEGLPTYSATKAAVAEMTRCMALDLVVAASA